jgi:hypothetical protein
MSFIIEIIQNKVLAKSEQKTLPTPKINSFRNRNEISFPTSLGVHIAQAARTLFQKTSYLFSKKPNSPNIFEKRGSRLNGGALEKYLDDICPKNTLLIKELFIADRKDTNYASLIKDYIQSAKDEKKQFVSIPIVSSGHIVHLLIELHQDDTATFEFFDSFGYGPEKYTKGSQTIQKLIESIQDSFKKTMQYSHSAIIQQDKHNCGIYVGDHFNKRVVLEVKKENIIRAYEKNNDIETVRADMGIIFRLFHQTPEITEQLVNSSDDF